jgi:hypothetical protein
MRKVNQKQHLIILPKNKCCPKVNSSPEINISKNKYFKNKYFNNKYFKNKYFKNKYFQNKYFKNKYFKINIAMSKN